MIHAFNERNKVPNCESVFKLDDLRIVWRLWWNNLCTRLFYLEGFEFFFFFLSSSFFLIPFWQQACSPLNIAQSREDSPKLLFPTIHMLFVRSNEMKGKASLVLMIAVYWRNKWSQDIFKSRDAVTIHECSLHKCPRQICINMSIEMKLSFFSSWLDDFFPSSRLF